MSLATWFKRNNPTILSCLGVVGVAATTVLAVKAATKSTKALEEAKQEKGEALTKFEVVKTVGPTYIPTVLTGAATIVCILSANTLNKRQQASLAGAYGLVSRGYSEYKGKVSELFGDDIDEEVKTAISKDKYKEINIELPDEDSDEVLFYDDYSGRYFTSTLTKVKEAEYQVNRDLTMREYVYLNEWYLYLGIPEVEGGWKLGWSIDACYACYWQNWIDFSHKKIIMDDGLECRCVGFFQEPILDFEEYL